MIGKSKLSKKESRAEQSNPMEGGMAPRNPYPSWDAKRCHRGAGVCPSVPGAAHATPRTKVGRIWASNSQPVCVACGSSGASPASQPLCVEQSPRSYTRPCRGIVANHLVYLDGEGGRRDEEGRRRSHPHPGKSEGEGLFETASIRTLLNKVSTCCRRKHLV